MHNQIILCIICTQISHIFLSFNSFFVLLHRVSLEAHIFVAQSLLKLPQQISQRAVKLTPMEFML